MFKEISNIFDVQKTVADKKEIKFLPQPNGTTIGCYLFMDSKTFDSPEALECRGITFDCEGNIVSRPLHKFFNIGEKEWLSVDKILKRNDIAAVFEKLDGSMIATAWVDNCLVWRSKKSFTSEVVKLTLEYLDQSENKNIQEFATKVAKQGMTAIFELTHPEARIVVEQIKPQLRLLHVRDNVTGKYVLLDPDHEIHELINEYSISLVQRFITLSISGILDSLENMKGCEGYVIQFNNGDMVKVKCPWYLRLHRSMTFLRERDIAILAINENLDDVKSALVETGIDLSNVNKVETRLKEILINISNEIEKVYLLDKHLERKDFAIKNNKHPFFGLIMERYLGKEVPLTTWYSRNRLKEDFTLRSLVSEVMVEAIEG